VSLLFKNGVYRLSSVDSTNGGSESTDETKISTDGQNRAVATLRPSTHDVSDVSGHNTVPGPTI
jgi:hypothetical protein